MNTENIIDNQTETTNEYSVVFYKFLIIIFLFGVSFFFGYLPAKITYFTTNYKLIGIANSFSGGIFLCVALLHLLPESAEIFEEHFEHKLVDDDRMSSHKHFPISFLLAFSGYTIIFIIEKVIFDSHTHSDQDEEESDNNNDDINIFERRLTDGKEIKQVNVNNNFNITIPLRDMKKNSIKDSSPQINLKLIENLRNSSNLNIRDSNLKKYLEVNNLNLNLNNQSDIKTRSISNMSKGRRDRIKSYLETFKLDTLEKNEEYFKNLFSTTGKISNMLLDKDNKSRNKFSNASEFAKNTMKENLNDPLLVNKNESIEDKNNQETQTTKGGISSYLLLLALSIHASFEGLALGLQANSSEIFYMFLAISFHKWVEALSIGINLNKSKIEKSNIRKFIILFSSMTPLGIVLGMIFSGFSSIIEACFLSISAGSFIYISASEVVIEEFSVSRYKYEKFLGFLLGATIICFLTIFEHHH